MEHLFVLKFHLHTYTYSEEDLADNYVRLNLEVKQVTSLLNIEKQKSP